MEYIMKKLLLCSFLLSSAAAFAECNTGNVYTDIQCTEKSLKADKSALNTVYTKISADLDAEGKSELDASQKAWLNYRNKQCNGLLAIYASQAQGAGSKLITLSCEAEKTHERVQELKILIE